MRYVYRDGRVVPKQAVPPSAPSAPAVMSDIAPFRSPIDGSVIGSRSALREYQMRHKIRQIGNEWAGGDLQPRPGWWTDRKRG